MRREGARVTRDGLLALRKDPHMMHQANLRIEGSGAAAKSLAIRWLEAVLGQVRSLCVRLWPSCDRLLGEGLRPVATYATTYIVYSTQSSTAHTLTQTRPLHTQHTGLHSRQLAHH